MNKIDNFDLIREKLEFNNDNDFYVIELIKRRKDDNELSKSQKFIDCFEVSSLEDFDTFKKIIIDKCNSENARAYIRVNVRNRKKIALEYLRELGNRIANEDYNIRNIYQSVLGKYHSDKNKKWIIDIDCQQKDVTSDIFKNSVETIERFVENLYNSDLARQSFVLYRVPTKSGMHIICSPFNTKLFSNYFSETIHKDNPTLLYYNKGE